MCNVTLWCVWATIVAVEKLLSITYSECVSVALVIQHAMHMHLITICSLSSCTVFSTLSHKCHAFLKKMLLIMNCVF